MGKTHGLLLTTEIRKLVIKEMACPYVATVIGNLIASYKMLLCVEGVQDIVLFVLGLDFPKHCKDLAVSRQKCVSNTHS